LTITSSSGNQICEGSNVTLTGSLTGSAYTYQWYKGTEAILGANSSSYTTTVAGNFKLVADNGTCLAESNVIVLSPITFNVSFTPSAPITLSPGQSETIVVTTSATNPVFQWLKDGNVLSETSNTLTVNETGMYTLIVNQTSGCIVSEEIEILVQGPQINDVPNLISPNNDGSNEKWILPTSITSQVGINVKIFNASGKMVLNTDNYENNWPINESDFVDSNSVFFYIISKGDQKIKQGTITVIK
jgi:gliding motility-associated-like protein